jgi:glucose/arabinose dehydrogenase
MPHPIGRRDLLAGAAAAAAAAGAGPAAARMSTPLPAVVLGSGDPPEARGVRLETVAGGLEHPWCAAWLDDGTALITERPGRLRVLRDGVLLPDPVEGTPEALALGQGGLFDVLPLGGPLPDGAGGRLLLSLAAGEPRDNRLVVVAARLDGTRLRDAEVVLEGPRKAGDVHFGGRLALLPDGTVLATAGDGGAHAGSAGDRRTRFGKILRFRPDGSIPDTNPLRGDPEADPAVWSLGHRNPQGLAVRPAAGGVSVWSTEHGARFGDELNRVAAGADHGWPRATWSDAYRGGRIGEGRTLPGLADPVVAWTTAWAPSGLAVCDARLHPDWAGDLAAGGLRSMDVKRFRLSEDGTRLVGVERIPVGARVRDVRTGPDGLLYALTDEPRGRLLRIRVGDAS